jgi:hypothetical protein
VLFGWSFNFIKIWQFIELTSYRCCVQTLKIVVLDGVTRKCSKSLCRRWCSWYHYVMLRFCCFAIFFLVKNLSLFRFNVAILTVLLLSRMVLKNFVLWKIIKQIGKLWKFLFDLALRFTYSVIHLDDWCWSRIRKIPIWKAQIFNWNLLEFCRSFELNGIQRTTLISNS